MISWWHYWLDESRHILKEDAAAHSVWEVYFVYPSIRALKSHHRAKKWLERGFPIVARFISERAKNKTGIEIHPGAQIGRHVFIDHGTGVVIGETAIVEEGVTIFHGVTLGGTGKVKDVKRHPTIKKGAIIGAGATVLGDVTIGEYAKIGAGAVVLKDVPAYATAVGIPARIIEQNSSMN